MMRDILLQKQHELYIIIREYQCWQYAFYNIKIISHTLVWGELISVCWDGLGSNRRRSVDGHKSPLNRPVPLMISMLCGETWRSPYEIK